MDPSVAYVDSDVRTMSYYSEYLGDYFKVVPFKDPLECIEACRERYFPLVLSRFENHPINGWELFSRLTGIFSNSSKILVVQKKFQRSLMNGKVLIVTLNEFKRQGHYIVKHYLDVQNFSMMGPDLPTNHFPKIIGNNRKLMEALKLARKAACQEGSVLITGDTGTGKELLARLIHRTGNRRDGPFQVVNCAAVNPSLFESEFFGHCKGAYTGACESMDGHFFRANKGILVLDEISEIDLHFQANLLRAIENHEIYPVGSQKMYTVDTRILALTNQNLEELTRVGKFRADLYYRLNNFRIHLPPLSERADDIEMLSLFFIHRFYQKSGESRSICLTKETVQFLEKLDYRGNVRELENKVTEVLVSKNSHNGNLTLQDFWDHFSQEGALESPPASQLTLKGYLKSMEKKRIVEILKNRLNNITFAAQDLGISRQNLQYRLKKLHIRLGVML